MNRSVHRVTQNTPASRPFRFRNTHRAIVALALLALVPASAVAQYPGGGGSNPSYGSKGAVIGGVAAGAAAGAGLLYLEAA